MNARRIADRYEIGETLGHGGMADVYAATDSRLGRVVAIKLLREDLARDPSFVRRFESEALSAARLNHPGIVSVFDVGEDQPDTRGELARPYIVMERVEGQTLRALLDAHGPLPVQRALTVAAAVAGALGSSHEAGVIHNDVKPGNVMVTADGAVKIMDFGIAQALADMTITLTKPEHVLGTARYMAPEVAEGRGGEPASDLYALGCVLFEMLTGRTPFEGDPATLVNQHLHVAAPRVSELEPDVPGPVSDLVAALLAKDPADRLASAQEVATRLGELASTTTRRATAVSGSAGAVGAASAAGASSLWGANDASAAEGLEGVGGFTPLDVPEAEIVQEELPTSGFRPLEVSPATAPVRSEGTAGLSSAPDPLSEAEATTDVTGSIASRPPATDLLHVADTSRVEVHGEGLAGGVEQPPGATSLGALETAGSAGGATTQAVATGTAVSGTTRLGEATEGHETGETGPIVGQFSRRARRQGPPWWAWPLALIALLGVAAGVAKGIDSWSDARTMTTVPDVQGMSQQEAEDALNGAGLEVGIEARASQEPSGTVLEQDPAPDSSVSRGTRVNLVVAASQDQAVAPSSSAAEPSQESSSEPGAPSADASQEGASSDESTRGEGAGVNGQDATTDSTETQDGGQVSPDATTAVPDRSDDGEAPGATTQGDTPQAPGTTAPGTEDPDTADPGTTTPGTTDEPTTTEPTTTDPTTDPTTTDEPTTTDPTTDPTTTDPTTDPTTTDPTTDPTTTGPTTTDPTTDPTTTEPTTTDPTTDPTTTDVPTTTAPTTPEDPSTTTDPSVVPSTTPPPASGGSEVSMAPGTSAVPSQDAAAATAPSSVS